VFVDASKSGRVEVGEYIKFRDVNGMKPLEELKACKVVKVDPSSSTVTIDVNTTGMPEFQQGNASAIVVKVPFAMDFASLAESRRQPVPTGEGPDQGSWHYVDYSQMMNPVLGHVAHAAIDDWIDENPGKTVPVNDAEFEDWVVAKSVSISMEEIPEDCWPFRSTEGGAGFSSDEEAIVREIARGAGAEAQPLAAFFGGIAAQEAVKVTGRYTPLMPYMYYDGTFALPWDLLGTDRSEVEFTYRLDGAPAGHDSKEAAAAAKVRPSRAEYFADPAVAESFKQVGDRYDDLRALFGQGILDRLAEQRVFLVGAGALGCELLKNFAILGVATNPDKGRITVTDMDRIENSNLNRQFLFRKADVQSPKSATAARASISINPSMVVEALEVRAAPDTERTFTDSFWDSLTLVVPALDNMKARKYVDSKCVWHGKPMVESGTLGVQCSLQVVLPH